MGFVVVPGSKPLRHTLPLNLLRDSGLSASSVYMFPEKARETPTKVDVVAQGCTVSTIIYTYRSTDEFEQEARLGTAKNGETLTTNCRGSVQTTCHSLGQPGAFREMLGPLRAGACGSLRSWGGRRAGAGGGRGRIGCLFLIPVARSERVNYAADTRQQSDQDNRLRRMRCFSARVRFAILVGIGIDRHTGLLYQPNDQAQRLFPSGGRNRPVARPKAPSR
jgi:hypothetical protein